MAITRQKKEEIVENLTEALKRAKSLAFVNFKGLSVGDVTEMRKALKEQSVSYKVAKKNLVNRVLDAEKFDGEKPLLEGELALAWSEDPVASLREVHAFQKKFAGGVNILGAVFEGKYIAKPEAEEIALIPSLDVLRGKFVNIINSPIQRTAVALSEIAKSRS